MLDGFDEVADIPTRNRLVAEISDAATRLEVSAKSLQVVVTSRPAAFANSPGFSREEWQHIEILALSRPAIDNYTKKWLEARSAEARERREITTVLNEKLNQPHVRDLARNPMQLAILLALISVQGASLPDKRTHLYDRYMDIYFDRECEKSKIVRDHRTLLIQVHRFLAWTLQVEAEGKGSGNISESRLRDLLRSYLSAEGHETDLVDDLFTGLQERVGALVSRVQGTYEFEVQPLREYFAARYLYDTAPYSTAGSPRSGTLPERFNAIATNFYWLNAARFYAGCYDSGELASLLDSLEDLKSTNEFQQIGHIPNLAITLLSDYVFSQSPKLVTRLIDRISEPNTFRILLAINSRLNQFSRGLQLPPRCGGLRLTELAKTQLAKRPQGDTIYALSEIIRANGTIDEISAYWHNLRAVLQNNQLWLSVGMFMGVIRRLSTSECVSLINEIGDEVGHLLFLIGQGEVFEVVPDLGKKVFNQLLLSSERYYYGIGRPIERQSRGREIVYLMNSAYLVLSSVVFRELDQLPEHLPLRDAIRRFQLPLHVSLKNVKRMKDDNLPIPRQFLGVLNHVLGIEVRAWKTQLEPWSTFIEAAREIWGDQLTFAVTAIYAANTVDSKPPRECSLADPNETLCDRAVYAKQRSDDPKWWREQLASASVTGIPTTQFALLAIEQFASIETIITIAEDISVVLDGLPDRSWHQLARACSTLQLSTRSLENIDLRSSISPRLATLLVDLLSPDECLLILKRYLLSYNGRDPSVLQKCADLSFEGLWDSELQEQSLKIISNVYKEDICPRVFRHHVHPEKERELPVDIAHRICSSPMDYPLSLIANAESALRTRVGFQLVPVGVVAERDNWFAD